MPIGPHSIPVHDSGQSWSLKCLKVSDGIVIPSCGISISRKVRMKFPPGQIGRIVIGKKGSRKALRGPKGDCGALPNSREIKSGKIDETDKPGKRLRHALDQSGRGGAQEKKSSRTVGSIHKNPQQLEKVGPPLNFINDHQSGKIFQNPRGGDQPA